MALEPSSPWHIVEASVLLSLTPCQVANGGGAARNAAARAAFKSFFMRYNRSLGGVVVARRGNLRFPGDCVNARLVGASPFAHITAHATLLLFAPQPGSTMTGTVTHVGPDHVGMSVLRVFHAVLPLSEFLDDYVYEQGLTDGALLKWWRYSGDEGDEERESVRLGSHIRFLVKALRSSTEGLFHIGATLDAPQEDIVQLGLGLVDYAPEIDVMLEREEDTMEIAVSGSQDVSGIPVAPVRKTSPRGSDLMQEMDAFDDDLTISPGISTEPRLKPKTEPEVDGSAPAPTKKKKKRNTKKRKKEKRTSARTEDDASTANGVPHDHSTSSDRLTKTKTKKRRSSTAQ